MRNFIKSVLLVTFCLGTTHADVIWPVATTDEAIGKIGILTKQEAENTLRIVESMPWIEEGTQKGEGKYMYVLYTPTSLESKELYNKTRPYLDQVNIRWVPILSNDSIDGLYETRTPEALEASFQSGNIPEVKNSKYIDLVSNMTFTGFIYLRGSTALSPDFSSRFPTVIYGNADKLFISIVPYDIEKIVNEIPVTLVNENTGQPSILELAKRKFTLYDVEKNTLYHTEKGKLAPISLFPSDDGVILGALDSDFPPTVVAGITDNGYIALDINGRGNYIYIKHLKTESIINTAP